jgi:4-hydroxybenzoate polyprenyltransferase
MNDELVERVLGDEPADATNDRGSIKRVLDDHRAVFGLFIVSGGTLTVMFLQGLIAGKLSVGMLPLFLIPAYCLYRIWRGVQTLEQQEERDG